MLGKFRSAKEGVHALGRKSLQFPPRALWQGDTEVSADPMLKPRDAKYLRSANNQHKEKARGGIYSPLLRAKETPVVGMAQQPCTSLASPHLCRNTLHCWQDCTISRPRNYLVCRNKIYPPPHPQLNHLNPQKRFSQS